MAGQDVVTFKGTLMAGPPKASSTSFPTGIVNASFDLKPASKPAPVLVHNVRNLASPSAYAAMDGIGTGNTVTKATFLYVRTESPMTLRITYDDGAGGSLVRDSIPVDGLHVEELPTDKFIKLLEAQGSGVLEYFASGNQ